MNELKMGKWPNPPLAYVVAEAVISPHYSITQFIPVIQQALRQVYPRTIDGADVTIDFTGASPTQNSQPVWDLLAADGGRGVHISSRVISLHATQYIDFPQFNAHLTEVLKAIEGSGLSPFVERLGLRYIDYILPSEGHETREYLVPTLHGVSPPGISESPHSNMWVSTFPFETCTVNARIAAPLPKGQFMPHNFVALPLAKPKTMLEAEERAKKESPIGIIDTDCTQLIGLPFNASGLESKFLKMHEHVSKTFKSFMSSLALGEWTK